MHPFTHISHYRLGRPSSNPVHRHPYWEWVIVNGGNGTTTVGEQTFDMKPGVAALYPPDTDHGETFDRHYECYVVGMRQFGREAGFHHLVDSGIATELAGLIYRQYSRKPKFWLEDCRRLAGVLAETFQQQLSREKEDPWVIKTEELLLSHLGNAGFRLEKSLEKWGLSPNRIHARFKAARGISPRQYLIEARLNEAARMLSQTAWSIDDIAGQLGFFDRFHFSRFFKRKWGAAPGAYRNRENGRGGVGHERDRAGKSVL